MDTNIRNLDHYAPQGTNQTGMRANNEKLVLSLLRKHGPMPKAKITKLTGLSAQTASVIMRALEADNLLIRCEPVRGKIGQPSVPMALNPDGAFFFGLKVGRRSVEMMLIDFTGRIKGHLREPYSFPDVDTVMSFAKRAYSELAAELDETGLSRVEGMGIATPFELWNWASMIGIEAHKMAAWRDFDLRAALEEQFALPVYLQNDASAACGAELTFGTVPTPANFLYFYVGHFVGGGVVLNDRVFTGAYGNAGALGPMRVVNRFGEQVDLIETSSIIKLEQSLEKNGLDPKLVWHSDRCWDIPDDILNQWLDEAAFGIAQAIRSALSVIDFEGVLIDGWLPNGMTDRMTEIVRQHFTQLDLTGLNHPEILAGSRGISARPLGAASLPLWKKFMVE